MASATPRRRNSGNTATPAMPRMGTSRPHRLMTKRKPVRCPATRSPIVATSVSSGSRMDGA